MSAGLASGRKEALFDGRRYLVLTVAGTSLAVFALSLDYFAVQAAIPEMAADLGTVGMGLVHDLTGYIVLAVVSGFGLGLAYAYANVVTQAVVPRGEPEQRRGPSSRCS